MKSALRNCITIILIIFCLLFMTSYLQNNKIVMPETPTVADVQKTNESISSHIPIKTGSTTFSLIEILRFILCYLRMLHSVMVKKGST